MEFDDDKPMKMALMIIIVVVAAFLFGVPLTTIMCVLAAISAFAVGALWYILWKIQRRKEAKG